jgi:mono/diheme cytochrome c family protein
MRKLRRALIPALSVATLAVLAAVGLTQPSDSQPLPSTAASFSTPQPGESALVQRGRYLAVLGDCMACHTKAGGGAPYAGGRPIGTPFGAILSANITSAAMSSWTGDQFYKALHEGIDAQGRHLYPAFPYNYFTRITRPDADALLAYLKTVPGVPGEVQTDILPFPFNIRALLIAWNALYLKKGEFQPNPQQSAEWNRGAYLVNGLGHCAACHTPRNMLGASKSGKDLHGGEIDNWVAPDLTGNERTGLGRWSADEIAEYLKTGRNAHANAGGAMAEVITYSTSLMSDGDRHAIAVYLKGKAAREGVAPAASPDPAAMRRGGAIYSDVCSACHLEDGVGQPRFFPPLGNDAVLQQDDAAGVLHLILAGSRTGPSPTRPSALTMPSYAWKLSDAEIADVATYVRNSWGNQARAVTAEQVSKLRGKLNLRDVRLTVNSGDRK